MANRKQLIEDILSGFHAIRHKMKAKAVHSGLKNRITHSQWFVLGIIEHCKKTNIKDVSEALGMSSSAATQLVEGLVQSGYVVRRADPKDRRAVELALSLKGKKRIATMREKRLHEMAKVFDALSDGELQTYVRLHKKITSKFLDKKS